MATDAPTIAITVKCFSYVRNALDRAEVALSLPAGATAGDAATRIRDMAGGRLDGIPMRLAVDASFVVDTHVLADGSELALIPPVQGG